MLSSKKKSLFNCFAYCIYVAVAMHTCISLLFYHKNIIYYFSGRNNFSHNRNILSHSQVVIFISSDIIRMSFGNVCRNEIVYFKRKTSTHRQYTLIRSHTLCKRARSVAHVIFIEAVVETRKQFFLNSGGWLLLCIHSVHVARF